MSLWKAGCVVSLSDEVAVSGALSSSPKGAVAWQRVPYDPSMYGPVGDWATDFDHADPSYNPQAPEVWAELRESGCPVAHSDRYGGMWVPVTAQGVRDVAYDTGSFTSRSVVVTHSRPGDLALPAPVGVAPPITSDPPFHMLARRLLLEPFAPKRIDALRGDVVELCDRLLAGFGDVGPGDVVDAATGFAQHVPVAVISKMLGFPDSDADLFRGFVHDVLEAVSLPPGERRDTMAALSEYVDAQIADHVACPRDDLTSYLLQVELAGEKLSLEHVGGTIVLLLVAGIDTTWSAIGSSILHFATHPDDLVRVQAEPELWPSAVEELLRFYAPVTMARMAAKDVEFAGCPVKQDDWVLLPFPAANRDPELFVDAAQFVVDREVNRHAAFGLGVHRCLGSNLARLELAVAVRSFVERFERFELAGDVVWSVGQVRGPRVLPVRLLG